jgi:hypothetical protein
VSDDAVERLVGAAERLGEYLVWLSKQDAESETTPRCMTGSTICT